MVADPRYMLSFEYDIIFLADQDHFTHKKHKVLVFT